MEDKVSDVWVFEGWFDSFYSRNILCSAFQRGSFPRGYKESAFGWCRGALSVLLLLFSHSGVSSSLWLHGLKHTRRPCPPPTPGACSNSCPSSWWWHPTISSSVAPFSSCPQPFPESWSFPMSQVFTSSGQSIGASASASFLPTNIQGWFPLGLTSLISLLSKGLLRVFSALQFERINSSALNLLYGSTLTSVHDYWKIKALTIQIFIGKVMSLLFNAV